MLRLFEIFFPLFQCHACKLAELSACIAKCMTTFFTNLHLQLLFPYNFLIPVMYYLCCLFWQLELWRAAVRDSHHR